MWKEGDKTYESSEHGRQHPLSPKQKPSRPWMFARALTTTIKIKPQQAQTFQDPLGTALTCAEAS
jgi:hypothetical protein